MTEESVTTLLIEEEIKESYMTYAMSVLTSRALPDVRDGLKPSQRRILVAMNDLNLTPGAKFRKCAKITGDTSGNYHPHGEQVIYPTLVRLAQPFNMRYPLVQGQGNFGSMDGDPPAAQRYTEARFAQPAMDLLEDLEKDTVDLVPNYDDTRREPWVLPGKLPNLLCNGSNGIAVGMATNIPPHNLREVCAAITRVIDEPEVGVVELLKIIKGPDFPTGALICGQHGIREAYRTGRGIITIRSRVHFETVRGRDAIVVDEITYQLNRNRLIENIAELVKKEIITGIHDIRNESDRSGTRLVIEMKKGDDPEVTLNQLYKHSSLQTTFGINIVALVEGKPETLTLQDLLVLYKENRIKVIRRRTQFLLARARERLHIVEGLIKALDHIDEIIALIKASQDTPQARAALMQRFDFSEVQANAILQMRLSRLTGLERGKLESERDEIREQIRDYEDILARQARVLQIIKSDLAELAERHGDDRRTEITGEVEQFETEDLITEEIMVVTATHAGYIKRMPVDTYRRQGRGGRGVTGSGRKEGDFVEHMFVASTHDFILFFTTKGRVFAIKVYDLPLLSRAAKGRPIINVINLEAGENVASMISVRDFDSRNLIMATRRGRVKKTVLSEFVNCGRGIWAIKLDRGDALIGVELTSGGEDVMLCTAGGRANRFAQDQARSMGRYTRGVRGIRLRGDDEVVGMVIVPPETSADLLTVCANGYGKRTPFAEFSPKNRGSMGVILIRNLDRNGPVVAMRVVQPEDEVMLISAQGLMIRTAAGSISAQGRAAAGVRVIRVQSEDRVVAVARVVSREEGDDDDAEAGEPADAAPTDDEGEG